MCFRWLKHSWPKKSLALKIYSSTPVLRMRLARAARNELFTTMQITTASSTSAFPPPLDILDRIHNYSITIHAAMSLVGFRCAHLSFGMML